jgi:hypothetical protein
VCLGRPAEVIANRELRRTFGLDLAPLETSRP